MYSIEEQAVHTFKENIAYIESKHPSLHGRLATLEKAIEAEIYQEKFSLEYQNNYFDAQELASGVYLYGEDSLFNAQCITDRTNLQRTEGVFQAQKFVDFSPEMPDKIDNSPLHFHNALWASIKIIEYHKNHISKTDETETFFKCMFIGTGLGIHIPPTIKKLGSKIAFIMEENLELFRLSLFVTNYAKIAKDCELFFSVMQQDFEQRKEFLSFLNMGNNYNLYIKHIPFIKNYEPVLQKLQTYVLSQSHIMYGYSALLLRALDSTRYLPLGYSFINVNKTYKNTVFTKKPVLMLFSGPSTSKQMEWVVEHREKFILVTALSTCRLLNKYNICPDIVVHIDPAKDQTAALFEGLDVTSYFQQTICIFSSNIDEDTVKKFKKQQVFFIEQGTNYKKDFGNFTSASVGEYTYAILLIFGIKTMFILGLDLALDPITLKTHGELHPFEIQGKYDKNNSSLAYQTNIEYVKGNLSQTVPTLALYKISINEFARFTSMVKKEYQKIYNLGNGAYLEGASPLEVEKYNWKKFKKLDSNIHIELQSFFSSISSSNFRKVDQELLRYQLDEAIKLDKYIDSFANEKFNSSASFLSAFSNLIYDLSYINNQTQSDLSEVYYEFFESVSSYVFDLFNTKKELNAEQIIKEIHTIIVKQLKKISNLYITTFQDCLNMGKK